jgi:hypothetical protein
MMIEVNLTDTSINLNYFLPVRRCSAIVILNQFELVREASSENQEVFAILIVAANLVHNQSLKVLVNDDSANETIYLRAFGIEVHLALLVENSLLSIGT